MSKCVGICVELLASSRADCTINEVLGAGKDTGCALLNCHCCGFILESEVRRSRNREELGGHCSVKCSQMLV